MTAPSEARSYAPGDQRLLAIAEAFHGPGAIRQIQALGNGNVNDTYLVETSTGTFVLQRLNTSVFAKPEQVMGNLQVLGNHVQPKLETASGEGDQGR